MANGGGGEEIDKLVRRRFDIIHKLGKGAYGIVWQAKEKRTGAKVALKKCFDAFRNSTDAQRTYRETNWSRQYCANAARHQGRE